MTTALDVRTLYGYYAVYDQWAEIDSWEGTFLERNVRGTFARSITERRNSIRVLYDHGRDPMLGNKPLGAINELREDTYGSYYEVGLLAVPYNNDFVIPAADAGLLGASYRFSVPENGDAWIMPTRATPHNPHRLPERTIVDADLYEFGPVTFPQYSGATANVRGIVSSQTQRQQYIRRAYASLHGIRATVPPVRHPKPDRAEQFRTRAHAVALGRRHARTTAQRTESLERERALLAAAVSVIRGRRSARDIPVETRALGSVAVR